MSPSEPGSSRPRTPATAVGWLVENFLLEGRSFLKSKAAADPARSRADRIRRERRRDMAKEYRSGPGPSSLDGDEAGPLQLLLQAAGGVLHQLSAQEHQDTDQAVDAFLVHVLRRKSEDVQGPGAQAFQPVRDGRQADGA